MIIILVDTTSPVKIRRNKLIESGVVLGKEYHVSLKVLLHSFGDDDGVWRNILHFTTREDNGKLGSRIPGIWSGHGGKILICSDHGNERKYYTLTGYQSFQWIDINIEQVLHDGKYFFRINVNGERKVEEENQNPRIYCDLQVYNGSPWSIAAEGFVKDLTF